MSAAVTLHRKVTLTESSNKFLKYPCKGVLIAAEFGIDGAILWATFKPDPYAQSTTPVMVRNIKFAPESDLQNGALVLG